MPQDARPLARRIVGWALVSEAIPLYPLYALLFADTGLSDAQISALFAIWSITGLVAEVPSGALADRFSRRGAMVAAGVIQAAGYAVWVSAPGFVAFALGFVLWGLGGSLTSGAQEALLYDGLADVGAQEQYARVQGWVSSAGLIAQLPSAIAAGVLFSFGVTATGDDPFGGYRLVGWVSVCVFLLGSIMAARLPEPPRSASAAALSAPTLVDPDPSDVELVAVDDELGYLATLRAGVVEAATHPAVRSAAIAVAAISGFDALEEYFGLMARDWGVPVAGVPTAMLGIIVAGAAGAAFGGSANRLRPGALTAMYAVALVAILAAGVAARPAGLAGVAIGYGIYRAVLVVLETRLQERIEGEARATVTSVAGLAIEIVGLALFGVWALGDLLEVSSTVLVALVWLPAVLLLPRWLRPGSQA